ncbi:hypothetical protein EV687_2037 [Corticibacter populi]|nr:hypothetical protein EV687_2037 [Corticibacter populi]
MALAHRLLQRACLMPICLIPAGPAMAAEPLLCSEHNVQYIIGGMRESATGPSGMDGRCSSGMEKSTTTTLAGGVAASPAKAGAGALPAARPRVVPNDDERRLILEHELSREQQSLEALPPDSADHDARRLRIEENLRSIRSELDRL